MSDELVAGTLVRRRYKTMYSASLASLGINTAFDVAKSGVVAELLKEMGVHAGISAALEEMNVLKGKAYVESSETEFRCPGCIMQGSVGATGPSYKLARCIVWNVEGKWRAREARLWFGGEEDRGCQKCSILWVDNFWIVNDSNRRCKG